MDRYQWMVGYQWMNRYQWMDRYQRMDRYQWMDIFQWMVGYQWLVNNRTKISIIRTRIFIIGQENKKIWQEHKKWDKNINDRTGPSILGQGHQL